MRSRRRQRTMTADEPLETTTHTEPAAVAELMALVGRYALEELEVDDGGRRVLLRADPGAVRQLPEDGPLPIQPPTFTTHAPRGRPATAVPLRAPLSGIFYRSEKPDLPPYVEIGQEVVEGQTVGQVEAMKVFSLIPADRSGTVVEIVAVNGRLIQHGEVVLYIDPAPA